MIILGIIIFVLLIVLANKASDNNWDGLLITFITLAITTIVATTIIFVLSLCFISDGITAKEKIKMYQEENTKIEEQIDILVKQYMNYEKSTFKEFSKEDSMTLISLLPELKSDELVQQQINVYVENNRKIKEQKENKINFKLGKWLLYFGG